MSIFKVAEKKADEEKINSFLERKRAASSVKINEVEFRGEVLHFSADRTRGVVLFHPPLAEANYRHVEDGLFRAGQIEQTVFEEILKLGIGTSVSGVAVANGAKTAEIIKITSIDGRTTGELASTS